MDTKLLRQKILDLAIRGKLVPQDPNDEPASVLLEKIRVEKERLIKEKKIKPDKKKGLDKSHYEKKVPFEVPENWEWLKIKDVFFINPKNDLDDNLDVSFIPMQLISDEFTNEHKSEIRKWKDVKRGFTHFREGDIAVAKITPCFENRKSVILNNLEHHFGAGTTELHILRPILEPLLVNYTLCLIKSEYFINYGVSHFSGAVGQQRVGKNILEETWFPLPPLSEQNRIVAEVERLFELIDVIEESKRSLEQVIKQTKSKILGLALSGKLVPQNPEEEPASMLLERLRKNNKLKKTSDKSHYPFEVPEGWIACQLYEICDFERGVTFPSSAKQTLKRENTIACVRTANVQEQLELDDLWYIDKSFLKNNRKKLLRKNDIIISTANSKELVGKTSFVENINEEMCFGGFVMVIRTNFINNKFLFYYLRDCFYNGIFSKKASQTTNIANINTTILGNLVIKVPPPAEQQRIVNKIEEIFKIVDIMQENLQTNV